MGANHPAQTAHAPNPIKNKTLRRFKNNSRAGAAVSGWSAPLPVESSNRASATDSTLDDASFVGATLQGISINRGSAVRADVSGADLSNATFSDIDRVRIRHASVDGIIWGRCSCPNGLPERAAR
ncbi:MAG: hypothetical protein ACJAYU_005300 [Bradymonadia bacterium]